MGTIGIKLDYEVASRAALNMIDELKRVCCDYNIDNAVVAGSIRRYKKYDIGDIDSILDTFDKYNLLSKIKCVHVNDSKNIKGSHKDRHENIGFGEIGFETLINVIYNKRLENIPKILETPYIEGFAPYKLEIEMIRNKKFNDKLKEEVIKIGSDKNE